MSFPFSPHLLGPLKPPKEFDFIQGTGRESAGTSQTFTVNFGAAHADRRIIVGIVSRINTSGGTGPISSVTIGGVAATLYGNENTMSNCTTAVAHVPNGTSGNIVITYSRPPVAMSVAVYRALNFNSYVPTSLGYLHQTTTTNPSVTLPNFAIPADGVGIFGAHATDPVINFTPTNLTTNYGFKGGTNDSHSHGWQKLLKLAGTTLDRTYTGSKNWRYTMFGAAFA